MLTYFTVPVIVVTKGCPVQLIQDEIIVSCHINLFFHVCGVGVAWVLFKTLVYPKLCTIACKHITDDHETCSEQICNLDVLYMKIAAFYNVRNTWVLGKFENLPFWNGSYTKFTHVCIVKLIAEVQLFY